MSMDARATADGAHVAGHSGHTLKQRAADEARRFFAMFVYLWILFGLFSLHQRIILRQEGIGLTSQGFAFVNALVLAKVMLVAEDLNLSHWLRNRPLIYPIVSDALIFTLLFLVVHVLEEVIVGHFRGESLAASVPVIGGGGIVGLLCVSVILFFTLIPYLAFSHVNRALGAGHLRALLFGTAAGRR